MALWRCQNGKCSEDKQGRCIYDFEAERPVCPKCGIDGREFPHIVIKLETVHYERVVGKVGAMQVGSKELACQPGKVIRAGTHRSGSAKAVNCPLCRKTAEWRDGMANMGQVLEDKDYPIEIDLGQQVIRLADGTAPAPAETPAPIASQERPTG